MWEVIVLIPDHCLSIYFTKKNVFYDFLFASLDKAGLN